MARALSLLLPLLVGACFRPTPYSPATAPQQWRDMVDDPGTATRAEPPVPLDGPLTPEQTLTLALAHDPELAMQRARTGTAMAEVGAARQIDNPQLRLTNFHVDEAAAGQPRLDVGLRVPIPRPGTVRARVAGAEQAAAVEHDLTDDAERRLRTRVSVLFARLAQRTADLEHTARAMQLRAERCDRLAERAEQAVATRVDVAMAEIELAEAKREHGEARHALAAVEDELARLAGVRGPVRFQVDPTQLGLVQVALDRDALTEHALASRPELRAAHASVEEAQAEAHVAKSRAWPWFDWAELQYRASPDATPATFSLAVAMELPMLSWNRGEIAASRARVRERRVRERSVIVVIAAEVDEAAAEVERTAARVVELEQELLPAIEQARREAHDALATGALDPLVANALDVRAVDARREHLAALLEHREAVIELEGVVGRPLAPAPVEAEP